MKRRAGPAIQEHAPPAALGGRSGTHSDAAAASRADLYDFSHRTASARIGVRSGDWRFYGSFERSFSLPENVNADASKEITP